MRKILLFLTLCLPVLLIAQVDLEISVVYLDNGDVGQEINVILENKAIGYRAARTTNDLGKVTFTGLSTSGTYTAFVQATDVFYEARAEEISLRSNAKGSANIGLARKASYEVGEVVIGASTTKINTVNAEVASSLSREEIELLPTEGRDITRLLFRLPNVSQATGFYPEAPNVAINGANSLYTNYMIDGLDNNERFLGGQKFRIPVGFVQDITVLTNNFSAEFGNSANGVINLTTRSGSNETHGEVFAVTRPGPAIDGESPFAQRDLSGNQVKNGFQRYQGGFAL
ncbi:MAG: Plug domain-containing protein, partial [Bacteroidota bacterium]